MFWIILLIVLAAIIVVALTSFLAGCFYEVACEKGFDDQKYYWISFFCGVVGYLLVIALPDRAGEGDALEQITEH